MLALYCSGVHFFNVVLSLRLIGKGEVAIWVKAFYDILLIVLTSVKSQCRFIAERFATEIALKRSLVTLRMSEFYMSV